MTKRTIALLGLALAMIPVALPTAASAGTSQTLTVTLKGRGSGTVTSSPAGIDCPGTCAFDFPLGTAVTLSQAAGATSTFLRWSGDCSGAGGCQVTMNGPHGVGAKFAPSYRPDGWIKLCGLSTGCTVGPPPPHPWHGNNVYNTTGAKQTVAVRMEDGEGARFWILLQNDGAAYDTVKVHGCKGNRRFVVNAVLVGRHKRPDWRAKNITKAFKAGTATFKLAPRSMHRNKYFTLNIVAPTTAEGVSYRCVMTIVSRGQTTKKDTVVAKMTTY